jgi:hypothetical protein
VFGKQLLLQEAATGAAGAAAAALLHQVLRYQMHSPAVLCSKSVDTLHVR